jgi:hypothetical protein
MAKAYVLISYSEEGYSNSISAVTVNPVVAAKWEKEIKNYKACERILSGSRRASFRNLTRNYNKNGKETGEGFRNHINLCPDNSFEKSVWCKLVAYEETISRKLLKYARARVALPPVGERVEVYETE